MKRNEQVNGQNIRCYDNGGKSADRYTVVYMDWPENNGYHAVGMNSRPFHPQGIGQHCSAMPGMHLGNRIAFALLPDDCRKLVEQDTREMADAVAKERLEYLRGELRGECISYEELAELQELAPHIDKGDVELLEAAGVPEFPE